MEKKQYNYCLDFIKGIACIFVVFMHCEFPGILGTAVQAISRFCVPFFFMVSGYFCFRPLAKQIEITDSSGWGGAKLVFDKEKGIAYSENHTICFIVLLSIYTAPAYVSS